MKISSVCCISFLVALANSNVIRKESYEIEVFRNMIQDYKTDFDRKHKNHQVDEIHRDSLCTSTSRTVKLRDLNNFYQKYFTDFTLEQSVTVVTCTHDLSLESQPPCLQGHLSNIQKYQCVQKYGKITLEMTVEGKLQGDFLQFPSYCACELVTVGSWSSNLDYQRSKK